MSTKHIKPAMVDVGRGKEPARVPFRRPNGQIFVLPTEGATVTTLGPEGAFWARRLAEGSVVPYTAPKSKPKREG